MLPQQSHTIRAGESLVLIAKKYQQAGWQAIYFADCNRDFRKKHPDPDLIRPGAVVKIPSTTAQQRAAVQQRIQRLQQAVSDAKTLFAEQEKVMDDGYQEVKKVGQTIDTGAMLITTIWGLARLTAKVAQSMKLHGEALKSANQQLLKDALTDKAKQAGNVTATAIAAAKSESTNTVWLVTQSVAQAWCDLTSPSFWASTFVQLHDQYQRGGWDEVSWSKAVTTRPEDLYGQAQRLLRDTKMKALADLEAKIREARAELAQIR